MSWQTLHPLAALEHRPPLGRATMPRVVRQSPLGRWPTSTLPSQGSDVPATPALGFQRSPLAQPKVNTPLTHHSFAKPRDFAYLNFANGVPQVPDTQSQERSPQFSPSPAGTPPEVSRTPQKTASDAEASVEVDLTSKSDVLLGNLPLPDWQRETSSSLAEESALPPSASVLNPIAANASPSVKDLVLPTPPLAIKHQHPLGSFRTIPIPAPLPAPSSSQLATPSSPTLQTHSDSSPSIPGAMPVSSSLLPTDSFEATVSPPSPQGMPQMLPPSVRDQGKSADGDRQRSRTKSETMANVDNIQQHLQAQPVTNSITSVDSQKLPPATPVALNSEGSENIQPQLQTPIEAERLETQEPQSAEDFQNESVASPATIQRQSPVASDVIETTDMPEVIHPPHPITSTPDSAAPPRTLQLQPQAESEAYIPQISEDTQLNVPAIAEGISADADSISLPNTLQLDRTVTPAIVQRETSSASETEEADMPLLPKRSSSIPQEDSAVSPNITQPQARAIPEADSTDVSTVIQPRDEMASDVALDVDNSTVSDSRQPQPLVTPRASTPEGIQQQSQVILGIDLSPEAAQESNAITPKIMQSQALGIQESQASQVPQGMPPQPQIIKSATASDERVTLPDAMPTLPSSTPDVILPEVADAIQLSSTPSLSATDITELTPPIQQQPQAPADHDPQIQPTVQAKSSVIEPSIIPPTPAEASTTLPSASDETFSSSVTSDRRTLPPGQAMFSPAPRHPNALPLPPRSPAQATVSPADIIQPRAMLPSQKLPLGSQLWQPLMWPTKTQDVLPTTDGGHETIHKQHVESRTHSSPASPNVALRSLRSHSPNADDLLAEPWQQQFQLEAKVARPATPEPSTSEQLNTPVLQAKRDMASDNSALEAPASFAPIQRQGLIQTQTITSSASPARAKTSQSITDAQVEQVAQICYRLLRSRFIQGRETYFGISKPLLPWLDIITVQPTESNARSQDSDLNGIDVLTLQQNPQIQTAINEVHILVKARLNLSLERFTYSSLK